MKYLSPDMTGEEARVAYRKLARSLHPDVGGDEDEFKILADEYASIVNQQVANELPNYDDLMAKAGVQATAISDTLKELWPRTKVTLWYYPHNIEAAVWGNVTLRRMVDIESIINSFGFEFNVVISFTRSARKKPILFKTTAGVTRVNMEGGDVVSVQPTPIYSGRRYTIYQGRYHEVCIDAKAGHRYEMRRIKNTSLKELLGL